jgi:glycosyltransferase involved in cell wall biosynthesis
VRKAALYICYYTVTEALVRTQVVPYLRSLAERGIEIHLLTFEPAGVSAEQKRATAKELANLGITWHSMRYHKRPSLPATLYDILVGSTKASAICLKRKIRLIHARSHVSAAMGLILKRIIGCRFIFDLRGLLAEEYVDAGHWKMDSLKYRLTKRMERSFLRRADALVVLTERIRQEFAAHEPSLLRPGLEVEVIPCCIDQDRFEISWDERSRYRQQRGWQGDAARKVLVYAGKLGGWYLTNQMVDFFVAARKADPSFFLQILTQSDPGGIEHALVSSGVDKADFDIRFEPPDKLPIILAAADAGISFIKPCYSKLASSPTKVGEYLAAGLPVIANSGIGDCDKMLEDSRLGVLIRDFSLEEYARAARQLSLILDEESREYRRAYALRELSLANVGGPRYARVYEHVFGLPALAVKPATEFSGVGK